MILSAKINVFLQKSEYNSKGLENSEYNVSDVYVNSKSWIKHVCKMNKN